MNGALAVVTNVGRITVLEHDARSRRLSDAGIAVLKQPDEA